MEPLEVAALRWVVGDQPTEDLPDLATEALVRGLDTPALRELAGARPDDYWHIKPLFEATLEELGIELPDEQTALWRLVKSIADDIVEGTVSPRQGAGQIWELQIRIVREGDLRTFVGLASEWDDHPDHRTQIADWIVEAAADLSRQDEPRRWVQLRARNGLSPLAEPVAYQEVPMGELPISDHLTRQLAAWAATYDATWEPKRPGFASQRDAVNFVEAGRRLVAELQSELGDGWHVEYWPEPIAPPGLRLRRRR